MRDTHAVSTSLKLCFSFAETSLRSVLTALKLRFQVAFAIHMAHLNGQERHDNRGEEGGEDAVEDQAEGGVGGEVAADFQAGGNADGV